MDATFWALIALIIFLGAMAYLKIPAMITKALDERADAIKNQLEEARALREEAQQLLAEYQRKRKDAEQEASEMIEAAEQEASMIVAEAKASTGEYVERRKALAEQKIAQAEHDAIAEVRASAVDLAVLAAGKMIGDDLDDKTAASLFKASIKDIKANIN